MRANQLEKISSPTSARNRPLTRSQRSWSVCVIDDSSSRTRRPDWDRWKQLRPERTWAAHDTNRANGFALARASAKGERPGVRWSTGLLEGRPPTRFCEIQSLRAGALRCARPPSTRAVTARVRSLPSFDTIASFDCPLRPVVAGPFCWPFLLPLEVLERRRPTPLPTKSREREVQ